MKNITINKVRKGGFSMNEAREKLRADFYAKTDIVVDIAPESWEKYAKYLEDLSIEKINVELLRKNERMTKRIEDIMLILEQVITER